MQAMVKYLLVAVVLIFGGATAVRFFTAESWVYFALYGVGVPIAVTVEFLLAHRRGPESARTADRLIMYVVLGMAAGLT
jgi:hypothetical protein